MFKIDTKADFSLIRVSPEETTAKMAEDLRKTLLKSAKTSPFDVILVLEDPQQAPSPDFLKETASIQAHYLAGNHSFYLTPIPPKWKQEISEMNGLNTTPTIEEAIDMVMMENMERDLLGMEDDPE